MSRKQRVAIIGAGPAGVAAAIQLTRSGIRPVIFEPHAIGGLLKNAHRIENYPGFPRGVSGDTLVKHLRDHLNAWNITIKKQRVRKLEKSRNCYVIYAQRIYRADIVIVASGTEPVMPALDITSFPDRVLFEIKMIKRVRGKSIVIVGAGDAAYDYALHLGRRNKTLMINRGHQTRALPLLIRRARKIPGITIMNNARIIGIESNNKSLQAVILKRNRKKIVLCDYILYAIGRVPALGFLSPGLKKKFPLGDRTLYFIGDVKNGNTRQVAIAAGDGVRAAMKIAQYAISKMR